MYFLFWGGIGPYHPKVSSVIGSLETNYKEERPEWKPVSIGLLPLPVLAQFHFTVDDNAGGLVD